MKTRWLIALIATIIAAAVIYGIIMFINQAAQPQTTEQPTSTAAQADTQPAPEPAANELTPQAFENVKTPHYVSSDPANNALLTTAPDFVTINFNFDLASSSNINVTNSGEDVTTGPMEITSDNLTMRVPVTITQTGNYQVNYSACWPDGSCHDGSFGFSVDLKNE